MEDAEVPAMFRGLLKDCQSHERDLVVRIVDADTDRRPLVDYGSGYDRGHMVPAADASESSQPARTHPMYVRASSDPNSLFGTPR